MAANDGGDRGDEPAAKQGSKLRWAECERLVVEQTPVAVLFRLPSRRCTNLRAKARRTPGPLRLILQRYKPAGSRQDSFSAVFGMD